MKKIIVLTMLFISFASLAAGPKVEITSFVYSDKDSHVAELCGKVSEMTTFPTFVQIIVDESSQPARYNSLAGGDGYFCLTVTTYAGTAIARILEDGGMRTPVSKAARIK